MEPPLTPPVFVWFRRDLRALDHAAPVPPTHARERIAFLSSTTSRPAAQADRRVEFIRESLGGAGCSHLHELSGHAGEASSCPRGKIRCQLAQALGVNAASPTDDETSPRPFCATTQWRTQLARSGWRQCNTYKDHTVLERDEVLTQSGTPYSVFTPYKMPWLRKINAFYLKSYPVERHAHRLAPRPPEHTRPCPRWVRSALNKALWVS